MSGNTLIFLFGIRLPYQKIEYNQKYSPSSKRRLTLIIIIFYRFRKKNYFNLRFKNGFIIVFYDMTSSLNCIPIFKEIFEPGKEVVYLSY